MPLSLRFTTGNNYALKVKNHFTQETCVITIGEITAHGVQLIMHDDAQKFRFDRVDADTHEHITPEIETRDKFNRTLDLLVQERESIKFEQSQLYPNGYMPNAENSKLSAITQRINKVLKELEKLKDV